MTNEEYKELINKQDKAQDDYNKLVEVAKSQEEKVKKDINDSMVELFARLKQDYPYVNINTISILDTDNGPTTISITNINLDKILADSGLISINNEITKTIEEKNKEDELNKEI